EHVLPSEPDRLMQRALTQSSHVIGRDRAQFSSQVYARLLAVEEPELRAFENEVCSRLDRLVPRWPALAQADSPLLRTLEGHTDWVRSLALSGDWRTLFSGSDDNTIKVRDASSGRLLRTLEGHTGWVRSLALSGDGRTLFSGSDDNTIKVWEASSGRLLRTLEGHTGWVMSLALSGDGRTLFSGSSDNTIKVWEASSGRLLRTL